MLKYIGLDWRILSHRILCYIVIGLILSLTYCFCFEDNRNSVLFIGDLPGFYSQGRIVLEGAGHRLYDIEYQRVIQNTFWPGLEGGVLPTMYPPIVGLVMASVAWLPPLVVRVLLTSTSFVLLIVLVKTCAPDRRVERFTLLLTAMPIFLGLVGTQNTVISITLLVLCRHYLTQERPILAGIFAGLLFYKPQLGLLFAAVFLPLSGILFFAAMVCVVCLQYLIGVWVYGGEWFVPWVHTIRAFADIRMYLDGFQMTSATHVVYSYLFEAAAAKAWEIGTCALIVGYFALSSLRRRGSVSHQRALVTRFLTVFPLFTPQIMFYELGIPLFFLFSAATLEHRKQIVMGTATVVIINICVLVRSDTLSLVPLASVIMGVYAWYVATTKNAS